MTELSTLKTYLGNYVAEAQTILGAPFLLAAVQQIVPVLLRARAEDRTIFFFGNGGSASTASHFVTDIAKVAGGTEGRGKGRRFRCVSLNDNIPGMTAWANDVGYAEVFAGQLKALAEKGDVTVAISGSGNSPNVLEAVKVARALGLTTIGLTGIGSTLDYEVAMVLAAVGPLQFEVVQFRLEIEYGAASRLESAPWTVVRWA
jgi:D-sedoheptulose 7-phosphate isomerase